MLRGSTAGDPLPFPAALLWLCARGPAPRSGRAPSKQLDQNRCGRSLLRPHSAPGETFLSSQHILICAGLGAGAKCGAGGAHTLPDPPLPIPAGRAEAGRARCCGDPVVAWGCPAEKPPRSPRASRPPRFGRGSERSAVSSAFNPFLCPVQPRLGDPKSDCMSPLCLSFPSHAAVAVRHERLCAVEWLAQMRAHWG